MSKLRRPFLSNRYFFITVRLLKRRNKLGEEDLRQPAGAQPSVSVANAPNGAEAHAASMDRSSRLCATSPRVTHVSVSLIGMFASPHERVRLQPLKKRFVKVRNLKASFYT